MFNKNVKAQIEYLTKSDEHNLWLFNRLTDRVKELENKLNKSIKLIYDYLDVSEETINDTFLVDNEYCCDDCLDRIENLENEEKWEEQNRSKTLNKNK